MFGFTRAALWIMTGHTLRTAGWTVLIVLVIIVFGVLATVFLGAYNVAATEPHTGLTRAMLNTLQQRSVGARADDVGDPPPLDSAAMQEAWSHYPGMCAVCHGAPGEERGEIGKGMTPTPPRLERMADEWTDREIFWILKHGIKLAGMPAFGETHSDDELWALTAVVGQLPELSPEEYQSRTAPPQGSEGEQGGDGEPGHTH